MHKTQSATTKSAARSASASAHACECESVLDPSNIRIYVPSVKGKSVDSNTSFDAPKETLHRYIRGGNFHPYMNGQNGPWIYVKEMKDASNKSTTDDMWASVADENVPCFSKQMKKVSKKDCGVPASASNNNNANMFSWKNAWLFVINLYECELNDPQLFNVIKNACSPSFAFHCLNRTGGVDPNYVKAQWDKATHIMLMMSDCGQNQQNNNKQSMSFFQSLRHTVMPPLTCEFMVLGFAFLQVNVKPPNVLKAAACQAILQGVAPTSDKNVYIDIVCSRFKVAQYMLQELVSGTNQDIARMLFHRAKTSYMCILRAIPTVYTYYPTMYGFTRTTDNRKLYPIFYVDINQIKKDWKIQDLQDEQVMEAMFGASTNGQGQLVWHKTTPCASYRVYRLEGEFKHFLKKNGLLGDANTTNKYFKFTNVFNGDYNGYLYGLYVPAAS